MNDRASRIVAVPDDSWRLEAGPEERKPRTPIAWPQLRQGDHRPTAIRNMIDELIRRDDVLGCAPADEGWERPPADDEFERFMRALGLWLFEQLPDDVQHEIVASLASGGTTRLVFHDVGEPTAEGLPWEYLAAPTKGEAPVFIGMDSRFSVLRSRRPPAARALARAESCGLLVVPIGVQPSQPGPRTTRASERRRLVDEEDPAPRSKTGLIGRIAPSRCIEGYRCTRRRRTRASSLAQCWEVTHERVARPPSSGWPTQGAFVESRSAQAGRRS